MKIRVATLNVWALPEPIGRDVRERIDSLAAYLPRLGLDIIAFQEVWTRDAGEQLLRAGERAGLSHGWFGDGAFGQGGLLVLSRLPIEAVEFEPFAVTGAPEKAAANLEYLSGKGFATVRVATPAGPLLLVNLHLHARYSDSAEHRHVPHRVGQLAQLAARHARSREPVIALGDFNFREGETDYRVLTDILGARDVAAALDRRQNTTLHSSPYRNPGGVDRRKDYIFARDGIETGIRLRRIDRRFDEPIEISGAPAAYSNHTGLVAEIELLPGQSQAASGFRGSDAGSQTFEEAARMLAEGEHLARARIDGGRIVAGAGLGFAAAATLGSLPERISRRRLLRASLTGAALAALAPSLGFTLATEMLVPEEIQAFRAAAAQLAALDPHRELAAVAAGPPA